MSLILGIADSWGSGGGYVFSFWRYLGYVHQIQLAKKPNFGLRKINLKIKNKKKKNDNSRILRKSYA
jgi:hypothetical protein